MPDNVQLSLGSEDGAIIATDQIGTDHYQKVKLALGAADAATLATGDQGNADAGTLRVAVADDDTNLSAIKTAVELIDNAISGTEMQVDIVAALPAGTNAIGKLAANSGTDIGDVDVTSVVPGTGATNLGKAEDAAHSSGDTGVMTLGVQRANPLDGKRSDTDGDYEPLHMSGQRLLVSPNLIQLIDNFSDHTSWAALNDDTTSVADETTNYIAAGSAVSFAKANGTSNTVYAIIDKTLSSLNFLNGITGAAYLQLVINIPDITNVVGVVVRLGTDSSNYAQWKAPIGTYTAGEFGSFRIPITRQESATGTGWSGSAVTYAAVGVEFDTETRTLAGIIADALIYNGGNVVDADISSESSVNTPNVNIQKVGNQATNTGAGNVGNGTQRVTIATDDANLATIAGAVSGTEMQVDVLTLPASTNTLEVVGDVAHDSPVGGNPVLLAGEARTTVQTAVGDGDVVRIQCDSQGRVITAPAPRDLVTYFQGTISDNTEKDMIAAGGAGVRNDLTLLVLSNNSSTKTKVTIRDAVAGTDRLVVTLAADGGGAVIPFNPPFPHASDNVAWRIDTDQATTSIDYSGTYVRSS